MIRRLWAVALAGTMLGICATALFGQSDVKIDIYEPGTAKIKIGVPAFRKKADSAVSLRSVGEETTAVIRDDLAFTGLFEVFDSPPPGAGASPAGSLFAPLKAWIPFDVQAVVHGTYGSSGGDVRLEGSLFDVESETRIVGKSYVSAPGVARRSAHRFADEIVYRYAGKRGVADTLIAYVKRHGANKEIHIMDYDGHNSYRLTRDESIALSPDWSPDGRKLAFTSYKNHNPDTFVVDLEKRSYDPISVFIGLNSTPAFSPDGKTLALTLSKPGNPEIFLLDIDSGELTRLTRNRAVDTSPTWSPNGRELAFVSDRSGYPQIYIIDREGVDLRRLTYNGYNNTAPAWSPAGDEIAYVSTTRGRGDIYTIKLNGSSLARLTYDGGNEDPAWSPGGRYLAYSAKRGGQRDIYLMRADGSGKKRITSGGGDKTAPAWSR